MGEITSDDENIIIGDRNVRIYAEKDPAKLNWGALDNDLVFE